MTEIIDFHLEVYLKNQTACIHEYGGKRGSYGFSQIILNSDGSKPKGMEVIKKTPNWNQARIPIMEGMLVLRSTKTGNKISHRLYRIVRIPNINDLLAQGKKEAFVEFKEVEITRSAGLTAALAAAEQKMKIPNCTQTMYVSF
jgi:hypothetical protein